MDATYFDKPYTAGPPAILFHPPDESERRYKPLGGYATWSYLPSVAPRHRRALAKQKLPKGRDSDTFGAPVYYNPEARVTGLNASNE